MPTTFWKTRRLILDGTDNFETRYLLNDYCVRAGIPWIYGGAVGSYGIAMPVVPGRTACFACVYPEPPAGAQPTCETSGVLGPVTALVGSLQVSAAMKWIVSGEVPEGIATADVWTGELRRIAQPARDPGCRACGRREFVWLEGRGRAPISMCGRNAVQIHELSRPLDLEALAERLRPLGQVRANEFALRFEIEPYLLTVFPDGRAIVKGTTDAGVARSLYARYIGAWNRYRSLQVRGNHCAGLGGELLATFHGEALGGMGLPISMRTRPERGKPEP